MNTRDILRYGFVFLTFLGTFSTYPKATYQASAEAPTGDVIYISTPQEFQDINLDLTAHYEIINDIDFTDFYLSIIAPDLSEPFTGIIDGMGYSLTNVIIPNSNNYLIRQNNGIVSNVNFIDIAFFPNGALGTNKNYLSIINFNYGTLENIKVSWKNENYNLSSGYLVCLSFFVYENFGLISQIIVSTISINQPFNRGTRNSNGAKIKA